MLACGLSEGGRAGARRALSAFLHDLATCGGPFSAGTGGALGGFNLDHNPWFAWLNAWQQQWSPYQFNPNNHNLLRELLTRHISEPVLRSSALRLFVTATSVRTGQPHVFSGEHLSIDALLASACLPQLFQAITIAGEPYWDGGYVGNPALWPLIYETQALDILLVQLDPLVREGIPTSAIEIADLHLIEQLFGIGRAAAMRWLAQHRAAVGVASSFDFEAVFLKPRE